MIFIIKTTNNSKLLCQKVGKIYLLFLKIKLKKIIKNTINNIGNIILLRINPLNNIISYCSNGENKKSTNKKNTQKT